MRTANLSNYINIQYAMRNLITQVTNGIPGELGDYSKITQSTPNFVIAHARLYAPESVRMAQFEYLDWYFPVHFFFDYQSDAQAHALVDQYRLVLIQGFMQNPLLAVNVLDANNQVIPYPAGQNGHAMDSKLQKADLVNFISLDEKMYAVATYEVWVREKILITSPS